MGSTMEPANADGGSTLAEIGVVTAVPAVAMALGSAAISAGEPSERLQARLQHFSAGLLIGAIVTDIFPILRRHLYCSSAQEQEEGPPGGAKREISGYNLLAAVAGVLAALGLMYGLKSLGLEEDEEDGE